MLTQMSDADWEIVVEAFQAARSRRGDKGRDDRKFLKALHFFTVHNITWRALPPSLAIGTVWKRFWRLSRRGVFEAMLALLAGMSGTAHLVQMVDSTIVRAHVSAAGAKGGRKGKLSVAHAAASRDARIFILARVWPKSPGLAHSSQRRSSRRLVTPHCSVQGENSPLGSV
jgi:transposase